MALQCARAKIKKTGLIGLVKSYWWYMYPDKFQMQYVSGSWKGVTHKVNQDDVFVLQSENYNLFFIFDGVSSSTNAKEGIQYLIDFCKRDHSVYFKKSQYSLMNLMEDMNLCLLKSGIKSPHTTCCILYIPINANQEVKISHLGDSRIYGLNETGFLYYTKDDNDTVFKNMLTKCLGLKRLVEKDFYESVVSDLPTRFLMCTDGFYNVMDADMEEFKKILRGDLPLMKGKLEKLIHLQNLDDATFLIVEVSQV